MHSCFTKEDNNLISIHLVGSDQYETWLSDQPKKDQAWLTSNQFLARSGQYCLLPNTDGLLDRVILGVEDIGDASAIGALVSALPEGNYQLTADIAIDAHQYALAWGMACYQFDRYTKKAAILAKLYIDGVDHHHISALLHSIYLVRDLINTPTEDMQPQDLGEAVAAIAQEFGAQFSEIVGDELLEHNYPLIHAVGRAAISSAARPRLLDLRWGDEAHPCLTLVGKGVCYDTGGLSLKPTKGMLTMKKDMGGSAHVLSLARLIMAMNLPVRLRLLIPAVENAIGQASYRPGDVFIARNGLSVEITNTDAEGRLILADALAEAASEQPDLLIDFATLTGAARVAMGPIVAPFMTKNQELAQLLLAKGCEVNDPVWQLPLYDPYQKMLKSDIADCTNCASTGFAGAITAALFLQQFVDKSNWVHFDVNAWSEDERPCHPKGGDVSGFLAVWAMLQARYFS
jgi:leucyl aminopeptidase